MEEGRASFSIVLHHCADSCVMAFLHSGQHGVWMGAKRSVPKPLWGNPREHTGGAGLGVDPVGTDGGIWATG